MEEAEIADTMKGTPGWVTTSGFPPGMSYGNVEFMYETLEYYPQNTRYSHGLGIPVIY